MISRRDALKLGAAGFLLPKKGQFAPAGTLAFSQEPRGSWPMAGGNPSRSGVMAGPTPSMNKPVIVKWRFATQDRVNSSPAVVDGTVFVGSRDYNMYAIDAATGEERWRFTSGLGNAINSSPAVVDGVVYFGSSGNYNNLYAIDATTGEERWHVTIDRGHAINSSPAVVDGVVYIVGRKNLHAIDAATGEERWHASIGLSESTDSSPAVVGGMVYIGTRYNYIYAIDAATGEERWHFNTDQIDTSSPAVVDGVLYVGGGVLHNRDGQSGKMFHVYAIDAASGEERWRFTTGEVGSDRLGSSPSVSEGIIYIGSTDPNLYAIDATYGEELWRFSPGGMFYSSPAVIDSTVFVGSSKNNFYAIESASGQELWRFDTAGGVYSSPAVVDATLFFGDADGYVYALGNLSPVLIQDSVLRGAPSPSGVERGTAEAGREIHYVGDREERNSQEWIEVTIGDVTGWIPIDAIDPATLPPEGEIEYVYIPE